MTAMSSSASTGSTIVDLNHLINMVSMAPVGQSADVVIWRDRREHNVSRDGGRARARRSPSSGDAAEVEAGPVRPDSAPQPARRRRRAS